MFWVGVFPRRAGKGKALEFVLQKLGVKPSACIVAGDSGNDLTMFKVNGVRGTVVANAQGELLDYYRDQVKD